MIHIPQNIDSKYRFITLAAQRCNQLMRGAKPRVETRSRKPTTIAQEEVLAGLVEMQDGALPLPAPGILEEAVLPEPAPAAES
jgi:DNA-directed RNA polymerase omega subunit